MLESNHESTEPIVTEFVPPGELDYGKNRFPFEDGAPLTLDDAYLANQLPLLRRREHAARADPEKTGRYAPAHQSVVFYLAADLFDASATYQEMIAALRAASFAHKIDWDMVARRRDLLHATICGRTDQRMTNNEAFERLDALRPLLPFRVRVAGLWVGRMFNRGRFYLPVYPEVREAENAIHAIQRAFGSPATNFYAAGLINLLDGLDARETAELGQLVRRYGGDATLFETEITELALLETNDDLILSGRVVRRVTS